MKLKIPYPGVDASLPYLRKQVLDSIKYCTKEIPEFKNPEDLFYYLKKKFKYESDPKGEELFQTAQTLLKNNFHGISGAGDCDDGTILTLASLIANGFYNEGIVLAGNETDFSGEPIWSHIYSYVDTPSGRKYMDLTNPKYNFQRYYKYKQEMPIGISKNQIDMFLTLADGGSRKRSRGVPSLQFIHLPSKNKTVREDSMDSMGLKDFNSCMLREGYTIEQISEFAKRRKQREGLSRGGGKARREERRDTRKENKAERKEDKHEKKEARTENKRARAEGKRTKASSKAEARIGRAEAKKMRSQAKIDKANAVNPEDGSPLTKIIDTAGNIVSNMDQTGSGADNFFPEEQMPDGGSNYDFNFDNSEDQSSEIPSYDESSGDLQDDSDSYMVFGTPVNKKAANVGMAGVAALVLYKVFS